MIAAARTLRVVAGPARKDGPGEAVRAFACVAFEAATAGILLFGTPLPPPIEGFAAVVAHGTAVLVVAGWVRTRPSRRWLCVAAVTAVPCAGAAAAAAVLAARGRGSIVTGRRRRTRRRPSLTIAAVQRLGGALPLCDALDCGDEDQRRTALSTLSQRADSEAILLLRRAAAGPDPDLALSAALVLDEIAERVERRAYRLDRAEVQHEAG